MTKDIEKDPEFNEAGYKLGRDSALTMIGSIDPKSAGVESGATSHIFAGMLTTILHVIYHMAPTIERAEELIYMSNDFALEDFKHERTERNQEKSIET